MFILNPVDITGILRYTMKEQSGKPGLFPDVQMKMVKNNEQTAGITGPFIISDTVYTPIRGVFLRSGG